MESSVPSQKTVAATIRDLRDREEAQRLKARDVNPVPRPNAANLETVSDASRSETALETLLGLKPFVPIENLASYLSFISYLSKREEEDVFVRLIQFLAIHTKLGQKLPGELQLVGEEMVQKIRQALARDIGSWKEEHDSLIRIKHEFQGSIASMLKEHREAHQKHLTFLMDAVIKTVTQLETNQHLLSEELIGVLNGNLIKGNSTKGKPKSLFSWILASFVLLVVLVSTIAMFSWFGSLGFQ